MVPCIGSAGREIGVREVGARRQASGGEVPLDRSECADGDIEATVVGVSLRTDVPPAEPPPVCDERELASPERTASHQPGDERELVAVVEPDETEVERIRVPFGLGASLLDTDGPGQVATEGGQLDDVVASEGQ